MAAGANVKAVQQMLGHKSAAITMDVYADLFDSDLDDVAARMDAQRCRALSAHALSTDHGDAPGILGIVRDGAGSTVQAPVYPGPDGSWLLGVYLDSDFEFPVDVTISLEDVGGPSAGMMFALGSIDEMTPGAMTGGRHIAGTGTIDPDGNVGPIGGIEQKIPGARDAGAELFLVPQDNCAEALGAANGDMQLVRVSTLDQAIKTIKAWVKDPKTELPSCKDVVG